jgi:dTDP-4-dehydrorhamnose reductase
VAKLLIVGVDSMIGSNLALSLSSDFDVTGLCRKMPFHLKGVRTCGCRLDDPAAVASAVRRRKPRWVIHCGPLAESSWDQQDRGELCSAVTNVALALAEAARDVGSRLTFLSTDAVFRGPRMFHDEGSTDEVGSAAVRKLEQAVQETGALIVRTHCYGWSPAGQRCAWVERLADAMSEAVSEAVSKGRPAANPSPHHATPILATDLAHLLLRAYRLDVRGLIHLAGAERTSQRRLAVELAAAWGWPASRPSLLAETADANLNDAKHETSLDTRRARRVLGRSMPMLREGLARFVAQAFDGHRQRLRSAETVIRRRAA